LNLSHLLFIEGALRYLRDGKFLDQTGDIDIAIWGAVLRSLLRHNVAYELNNITTTRYANV